MTYSKNSHFGPNGPCINNFNPRVAKKKKNRHVRQMIYISFLNYSFEPFRAKWLIKAAAALNNVWRPSPRLDRCNLCRRRDEWEKTFEVYAALLDLFRT